MYRPTGTKSPTSQFHIALGGKKKFQLGLRKFGQLFHQTVGSDCFYKVRQKAPKVFADFSATVRHFILKFYTVIS